MNMEPLSPNSEEDYSSSFESSSSLVLHNEDEKQTSKEQNALDLKLLSDAVRELQRLNNQALAPHKFTRQDNLVKECTPQREPREFKPQSETGPKKLSKISKIKLILPIHRCSAEINRRRQQEKIDRENMLLLHKLHNAKPSTEITAWRKNCKSNSASAFSTRTNSRLGHSAN